MLHITDVASPAIHLQRSGLIPIPFAFFNQLSYSFFSTVAPFESTVPYMLYFRWLFSDAYRALVKALVS